MGGDFFKQPDVFQQVGVFRVKQQMPFGEDLECIAFLLCIGEISNQSVKVFPRFADTKHGRDVLDWEPFLHRRWIVPNNPLVSS